MQEALTHVIRRAELPYEGCPTYYSWLAEQFRAKRDKLAAALKEAGIVSLKSEGEHERLRARHKSRKGGREGGREGGGVGGLAYRHAGLGTGQGERNFGRGVDEIEKLPTNFRG